MAVPTRRQKSISNFKQNKWAEEHKKKEIEEKPISEEEHQDRLDKLKELGLLK